MKHNFLYNIKSYVMLIKMFSFDTSTDVSFNSSSMSASFKLILFTIVSRIDKNSYRARPRNGRRARNKKERKKERKIFQVEVSVICM